MFICFFHFFYVLVFVERYSLVVRTYTKRCSFYYKNIIIIVSNENRDHGGAFLLFYLIVTTFLLYELGTSTFLQNYLGKTRCRPESFFYYFGEQLKVLTKNLIPTQKTTDFGFLKFEF